MIHASPEMKARFMKLVEDFCSLCGVDHSMHILSGRPIAINSIHFLLRHREELDPARIYVRCDFGEITSNLKTNVYKALLEANLDLYEGSGPFFSVSPRTGHVLFTHSYRLDELNAAELRDVLIALVDSVLEWRSNHFLGPRPSHRNRWLPGERHS
jgi:hypothetical protein